MGKAEIIAELPCLNAQDRSDILQRLWELQEDDVLHGSGPTDDEKRILDQALAEFERDRDPGTPWRDAISELRRSSVQ